MGNSFLLSEVPTEGSEKFGAFVKYINHYHPLMIQHTMKSVQFNEVKNYLTVAVSVQKLIFCQKKITDKGQNSVNTVRNEPQMGEF